MSKSRGRSAWASLCLALVSLSAQGCSLAGLERSIGVDTSTSGEVLIRSSEAGELLLRPEACVSGDRANFRGVDLFAPGFVLRVAAEPIEGLAVALIDAETGDRRGIFRRSDCRLLRGDIQRTGWRINNVADVSGYLEADCLLTDGRELRGKIVFEHCH